MMTPAIMINDPHGFTLTLVSILVVFVALLLLLGLFTLISWLVGISENKGDSVEEAEKAAIAMALHLYLSEDVHDIESGSITFGERQGGWDTPEFRIKQMHKS